MKCMRITILWAAIALLAACSGGGDATSSASSSNRAPTIVSASEAVFPQTRSGIAYTIRGSDPDGDRLTYSIGGDDAASFTVDADSGELSFLRAPDVDAPASVDGDNFYVINVSVEDSSMAAATQRVDIEVSRHDPEGPFLSTDGAVFIGPDTIIESDASILQSITFSLSEVRTVPDNRVNAAVTANVNVYDAVFSNGQLIEMVINDDVGSRSVAEQEARFFAKILGQLDPMIVEGVKTVWVNGGVANLTGPPGGIVVHTDYVRDELIPRGVAEEVMAHEAVHATLDADYLRSSAWAQAQKADITFVTEYARDFPESEDLAESYGAYLIVKNAGRNPASLVELLQGGIPERIVFFQSLGL